VHATPVVVCEGWKASLSLSFEVGPTRTFVRREHTGPLGVQRPFYPEATVAHVYLLHPPGGVVGGDKLSIDARVCENAAGLVTTPGATKFYRSNGKLSTVDQQLEVNGGSLEWFPQENIFFNGCHAALTTTIALSNDAAFAGWDIQCYGRPAGNKPFIDGSVCNTLTVLVNDAPVFCDRQVVDINHPLSHSTTYRSSTVSGTLLLNRIPAESCDMARSTLGNSSDFFVTNVDSLLVVRYLGSSAEEAKRGFCAVWSQMRCLINQRPPCVPRIWAT
jgi:urease accessory protein